MQNISSLAELCPVEVWYWQPGAEWVRTLDVMPLELFRTRSDGSGRPPCHLYRIGMNPELHTHSDSSLSAWQRAESLLPPEDVQRAARFHFKQDQRKFVLARGTLRALLGAYTGIEPRELRFQYGSQGKPELDRTQHSDNLRYSELKFHGLKFYDLQFKDLQFKDLQFNVSHSGELALFAITLGTRVGVDVELCRPDVEFTKLTERFFSAEEQRRFAALPAEQMIKGFYNAWTRKESYIKAVGDGLAMPLSSFDVTLEPGVSAQLLATRPEAAQASRWELTAVPVPEGYCAAVCTERHFGREP